MLDAFRHVLREAFPPPELAEFAYADHGALQPMPRQASCNSTICHTLMGWVSGSR